MSELKDATIARSQRHEYMVYVMVYHQTMTVERACEIATELLKVCEQIKRGEPWEPGIDPWRESMVARVKRASK